MLKNVAGQKVFFSLFKSGARIANPTIAAGDWKVDLSGAGQANVTTPPTSDAAGLVTWLPSQAETNADYVTLLGNDAAGDEWEPITIVFETQMPTSVEAILVDTAVIGAAGAGLTALGDTRLANLDAAVTTRAATGAAMTLADNAITAAKIAADAGVEIAAAVEVDLSATHGAGSWLSSAGSGSISQTITVNDQAAQPLDGVLVAVYTSSSKTGLVASGYTDALGQVTFELDAGTYYVWKSLSGYNFGNPATMVVA